MQPETLIPQQYGANFQCIGPACEDSCCENWLVTVDKAAYDKYQNLPPGPLRTLVDANVLRTPPGADGKAPEHFASIRLLPSGACPFLTGERLCRIHAEQGEAHLCDTCASFPRSVHTIDGCRDISLSLSCPEAARLVLLDAGLKPAAAPPAVTAALKQARKPLPLRAAYWPVRGAVMELIRNRSYPLWQRIFLLGSFARRFEAVGRGELSRSVPELLGGFQAAVASGGLRASMETIRPDLALQFEMLLRLIGLRMHGARPSARLMECLAAFRQGVGHERGVSLEAQLAAYSHAFERHYAPFFAARPHILENYLINVVVRELFPFGKSLLDAKEKFEPQNAFIRLTLQFALLHGLLIGAAGFYKENFGEQHVVQMVQTVSRHFDHHPRFLAEAQALLAARAMTDARGLTALVRN